MDTKKNNLRGKKPAIDTFREICEAKAGIAGDIATALNIRRSTLYGWLKSDPEFASVFNEAREKLADPRRAENRNRRERRKTVCRLDRKALRNGDHLHPQNTRQETRVCRATGNNGRERGKPSTASHAYAARSQRIFVET